METDAALVGRLTREIMAYLEREQRIQELWLQVEGHMGMSYLAECLGDLALVPKHLEAAKRLVAEISALESAEPIPPTQIPSVTWPRCQHTPRCVTN
ncbi:MAG TPA: hypothetical protein VFB38_07895 [Chthonomonadaceae bacterium]|nr:hypothetical protein [Chthonomonadaceae bacterium]